MAGLQMCSQHTAERKMYIPRTGESDPVPSKDWPRQKLHSDFYKAPWVGENKD